MYTMFHKFRAWFEDEMIFSDCAIGEFEFVFDVDGNMEFNVWNDEMHKLTTDGDVTYSGWDTYTTDIMQCTGAKDMNGTDIYEGDIIRKEICSPDDMAYGCYGDIGVVKYDSSVMGFIIDSEDDWFYDNRGMNFSFDRIEIVGNIYENPEFLE